LAIVPIFPGETTLNAASVLGSQGTLEIELVIVAGALGAILGDSALYWITRTARRGSRLA
jgi:membrane protein DedA with SNARE-associated domain